MLVATRDLVLLSLKWLFELSVRPLAEKGGEKVLEGIPSLRSPGTLLGGTEKVTENPAAAVDCLDGSNVHHPGPGGFGQFGEVDWNECRRYCIAFSAGVEVGQAEEHDPCHRNRRGDEHFLDIFYRFH